jgi:FYVE zinc finger
MSFVVRGEVSHHCSICGQVVCVLCAPAGDKIPGEGFENFQTLPNNRLCAPSLGILTPQRACMHCYLDSYYLD